MGEKEVGHDGGFIYQLCFALWNHFYSIFANFFAFLGVGERGGKASTNPCFSSQAAL